MNILIIAAHPDDEILGCGGTIARLVKEGHTAHTLILGEGITSRDDVRDVKKREAELKKLKSHIANANQSIGVTNTMIKNFPDNRFDSVPLLDIVKVIEQVKKTIKPDIIFTHFENDLNIDHQITYKAVMAATRPMPGETVKEIYSFEVLSSTEWNYPWSFSPNTFYDITYSINQKLEAMKQYKTELREYPHPRSLEGIRLQAQANGMKIGVKYTEAFQCIRSIK